MIKQADYSLGINWCMSNTSQKLKKSYFLLICDKKACVDCSMAMSSYKYLYSGGEQLYNI